MRDHSRPLVSGDRVIPWRAHLPSAWRVEPLKHHVQINARTLGENTPADLEIDYIDIGTVDGVGRIGELTRHRFDNAPSRARRIVRNGDTLVSTVRTYLRAITYVSSADGNLICSTGFAVLSPGPDFDPRFLGYWMRSDPVVDEIVARSTGVSYPAVAPSEIGSLPIPVLQLADQRAIADYLDEKTAAIDALIAKKTRLIDLIEEKRQAAITCAVTKGLDPDVPMKDSGVEWIGGIPSDWVVTPIRRIARPGYRTFTDGDWIESPYITDEGIRLIQTGNIGLGRYKEQGFRFITTETFGSLRCTEVEVGDVLICRLADPVGRACLAPDLGCRMITSVDVAILKPALHYDPRFLVYFFSSEPYIQWVQSICRGGTRDRISRSMLGSIAVPVPPTEIQRKIADHLDREVERATAVLDRLADQLERLREYRQALISAAVTGQISPRLSWPRIDEVLEEALA